MKIITCMMMILLLPLSAFAEIIGALELGVERFCRFDETMNPEGTNSIVYFPTGSNLIGLVASIGVVVEIAKKTTIFLFDNFSP